MCLWNIAINVVLLSSLALTIYCCMLQLLWCPHFVQSVLKLLTLGAETTFSGRLFHKSITLCEEYFLMSSLAVLNYFRLCFLVGRSTRPVYISLQSRRFNTSGVHIRLACSRHLSHLPTFADTLVWAVWVVWVFVHSCQLGTDRPLICFIARLCTLSSFFILFFRCRLWTDTAYSMWSMTRLMYSLLNILQ